MVSKMKTLLIDNGTHYKQKIISLLKNFDVTVVEHKNLSSYVEKVDDFDLIVLSGANNGAPSVKRNSHRYSHELAIIHQTKTPIIGICLGAQLIAFEYGARLSLLPEKVKGIIHIFGINQNPFNIRYHGEKVFASHRWRITDLPPELIGLAASNDGIEIFRHCDKPLYGLQFHPERRAERNNGARIFRQIVELEVSKKSTQTAT